MSCLFLWIYGVLMVAAATPSAVDQRFCMTRSEKKSSFEEVWEALAVLASWVVSNKVPGLIPGFLQFASGSSQAEWRPSDAFHYPTLVPIKADTVCCQRTALPCRTMLPRGPQMYVLSLQSRVNGWRLQITFLMLLLHLC